MPNVKAKTIKRSMIIGAAASVLLASGFTLADWLGNPGGVFRSDDGTRWDILWDTFLSWFGPLVIACFLVAFVFVWLHSRWSSRRA